MQVWIFPLAFSAQKHSRFFFRNCQQAQGRALGFAQILFPTADGTVASAEKLRKLRLAESQTNPDLADFRGLKFHRLERHARNPNFRLLARAVLLRLGKISDHFVEQPLIHLLSSSNSPMALLRVFFCSLVLRRLQILEWGRSRQDLERSLLLNETPGYRISLINFGR